MPLLDLGDHAAYHEVSGAGEPVLLLHGGACSLEVLRPVADDLARDHRVHAVERPGHGRTPDREGPITYAGMVADTLAYLDAVGLDRAHVVGHSDGAIAGLLLARDHPDRVRSLTAISANLDTGAWVPEAQHARAVPLDLVEVIDRQYAALSTDGPGHAEVVEARLRVMWEAEPDIAPASLAAVVAPTLVMAGQHDMVRLDHTALIASSIAGGQLCVVPGASHLLVVERPGLVARVVREFLAGL